MSKIPDYPGQGEVCIIVSSAFQSIHPSLSKGDTVYIPISTWLDAHEIGKAPSIIPQYTNHAMLQHIPLNILSRYFITK